MAAQLLPHYTPSEQLTHSLLQHFNPPVTQLLAHFTPLKNLRTHAYNILCPWQHNS